RVQPRELQSDQRHRLVDRGRLPAQLAEQRQRGRRSGAHDAAGVQSQFLTLLDAQSANSQLPSRSAWELGVGNPGVGLDTPPRVVQNPVSGHSKTMFLTRMARAV